MSKQTSTVGVGSQAMKQLEPRILFAAVTFEVGGVAQWTDSAGGKHPIPNAMVDIFDLDTVGTTDTETKINASDIYTDAAGRFSVMLTFDNGDADGNPDVFARVYSISKTAIITPDSATGKAYSMTSAVFEAAPSSSVSVGTIRAGKAKLGENVFSVHHSLHLANAYTGALTGGSIPQVTVRYPNLGVTGGNSVKTVSAFNSAKKEGYILADDRWDWDVLWHEYGHFVMNQGGFVNNPGGSHSDGNLTTQRGSKNVGTRLAWGEGWPTFFGIWGQKAMGLSTLKIPLVGDAVYSDTLDASITQDLETTTGLGEDDETTVASVLWDLVDSTVDGTDESALFTDRSLYKVLDAANPTTLAAAWEAIAASLDTEGKIKAGAVFSHNNVAPTPKGPPEGTEVEPGDAPVEFSWEANGAGAAYALNDFRLAFYDKDYNLITRLTVGNKVKYTPTQAEWDTIFADDTEVIWVVEGRSKRAPATPNGALKYYWSGGTALNNKAPTTVFVIDDTGSMSEEIGAVRNSLQRYIDLQASRLSPGDTPPVFELITFKDSSTSVLTTDDLSTMRAAVGSLVASGGGDCPEDSAGGLALAASRVAPGGTILLATDASPQPGVDYGSLISGLRARGVTVNVILSGDCAGITSASSAAVGAPLALGEGAQGPAAFELQAPIDDHGNDAASATALTLGGSAVRGLLGGEGDGVDTFRVEAEAGTAYAVDVAYEEGPTMQLRVLAPDGGVLLTQSVSSVSGVASFEAADAGTYTVELSRGAGGALTYYQVSVSADPFAGFDSAIEVFSTIATETGGVFRVADSVNAGDSAGYEATVFNIMASTLGPAVLTMSPGEVPVGATTLVSLQGRGTNWRDGLTSVSVPGGGVTVLGVTVLDAETLRFRVRVGGGASMDARDVRVTTDLGDRTEVAEGLGVLEIGDAVTGLVAAEPSDLARGATSAVVLRGVGTSWTDSTTFLLGPGVTVDGVDVRSAGEAVLSVTVDDDAAIGFRTATAGGDTLERAVFIGAAVVGLPEVTGLSIDAADPGDSVTVRVTGSNTAFADGVTTATFGAGVDVLGVTVIDESTADVEIAVGAGASTGTRTVTLTTGGESAVLRNAFFVGGGGGTVATGDAAVASYEMERIDAGRNRRVFDVLINAEAFDLVGGRVALDFTVTTPTGDFTPAFVRIRDMSNGAWVPAGLVSGGDAAARVQRLPVGAYRAHVRADNRAVNAGDFDLMVRLAGDVDGDGAVDATDRSLVQAEIDASTHDDAADVTRDGRVDGGDLAVLGGNVGARSLVRPFGIDDLEVGVGAQPVATSLTVNTRDVVLDLMLPAGADADLRRGGYRFDDGGATADGGGSASLLVEGLRRGDNALALRVRNAFGQSVVVPFTLNFDPDA